MQNLETQKTLINNTTTFASHFVNFFKPSTIFLIKKDQKKLKKETIEPDYKKNEVLFAEIKNLLDDF